MTKPDVALLDIVLPTHNVGPWLADSLTSLCEQSLTRWHAYIVLDGCSDDSEKIAHNFAARDSRFTVHTADRRGVGHARNLGFALGQAPYVAFIDPDDLVPAAALSALTDSLEESGSDLATGHAVQFRDTSSDWPYWTMQSDLFTTAVAATNVAEEPRLILDHTTWNKVYRRAFLAATGIRFPEDVAIGEDAHHTLEAICAAQTVDVVPATVYRHRVRPHSLTSVIRNASSVAEWVTMTRGIESLVRTADSPAVTAVWLRRMLENEAWTRARQVGGMHSDESLESLLALLRDLVAAVPAATWGSYPLVIRWAYEVLGVTLPPTGDGAGSLGAALASSAAELGEVKSLPEFVRFEQDLKMSGTQLRAHVWRESLLLPFLRLVDRLDPVERRRALAHVLTFHDRFVAEHMLLPGEKAILDLARSERYDDLARWAATHRSMSGTALIRAATPGRLSITADLRVPALQDASVPLTLVAVSQGRIAGLTLPLGALPLEVSRVTPQSTPLANEERTAKGFVRVRALRPFGRWAVGALVEEPGEPAHFVPLQVASSRATRLHPALRTIVPASAVGRPLVFESKPGVPQRALSKLLRHRIIRGILRRVRAALSRLERLGRIGRILPRARRS